MRVKNIVGAVVTDLGTIAPFLANYTAVVANPHDSVARTIQFSDSATGPFAYGTIIPAGQAREVEIKGRYAAIENAGGTLIVYGN
jgi:hypothetical protein